MEVNATAEFACPGLPGTRTGKPFRSRARPAFSENRSDVAPHVDANTTRPQWRQMADIDSRTVTAQSPPPAKRGSISRSGRPGAARVSRGRARRVIRGLVLIVAGLARGGFVRSGSSMMDAWAQSNCRLYPHGLPFGEESQALSKRSKMAWTWRTRATHSRVGMTLLMTSQTIKVSRISTVMTVLSHMKTAGPLTYVSPILDSFHSSLT
ncbi:hypothetical protein F5148DRAFT_1211759 [Russula earlei]|uniref:Uncharacterized protein n=1 Tax=Russula earlei TaxID=71964 RepID=A0ACC0U5R7_9AGAM|nr:hypothetical protein F5148DRAFT_1211759 [Russula earlei]